MNISLIYFTESGRETCRKIEEALTSDGNSCKSSEGRGLPGGLAAWTQEAFTTGDALVFVSAAGIAVRAIAPYIKSKTSDPAVVVADERGIHVISLLSGHMGGANELTVRIAQAVGGKPVITTATDVNGRFAVDEWAKKQGLAIADMKLAKEVSAALLRNETIGFYSEFPVDGELPEGLVFRQPDALVRVAARDSAAGTAKTAETAVSGLGLEEMKAAGTAASASSASSALSVSSVSSVESAEAGQLPLGIAVCLQEPEEMPFDSVLWLMPKSLTLGIGCRRGIAQSVIRDKVRETLSLFGLQEAAVVRIASIDLKKGEQGLLTYAESLGVPFEVFSAHELSNVNYEIEIEAETHRCETKVGRNPSTGQELQYELGGSNGSEFENAPEVQALREFGRGSGSGVASKPAEGFTTSEFVRSVTGVDNVCERAAVLAAGRHGAGQPSLIVKKQAGNGVTVAVAADLTAFRICMKSI